MFSEEKAVLKAKKKTSVAKASGDVNFDSLEDKVEDKLNNMALQEKAPKKYSKDNTPGVSDDKMRKGELKKEKTSTHSLNLNMGSKKLPASSQARSNSLEKVTNDKVVHGLYEAASVMCNLVEVSTDSTMRGARVAPNERKMVRQRTQGELEKKASVSSQSGPFSSIKESQQKKKKSFDDENAD